MSCGAAWASKPPAEMQEQIARYSHGIMADWVPQQALLTPPVGCHTTLCALGLIEWRQGYGVVHLTWRPQQHTRDHHGRYSYVSLVAHIIYGLLRLTLHLRIVWPIAADQPMNAIHLSETLDVGFELIEVRHGEGAGKIYRNGRVPVATVDAVKSEMRDILERAYGEEGARKRANILNLRKTLQAAWSENGVARREGEALLDAI